MESSILVLITATAAVILHHKKNILLRPVIVFASICRKPTETKQRCGNTLRNYYNV
ncbi:hypothetical protein MuYL_4413 [Mucilaginibacter xinganensis]|uniref:Uncharacterized protein n=1 Tax=Mucilaginibacter xinganensis TaxID=1234841 RepID=A0A223P371_9SPHI|nr:hypothetical protein MuYL_4413 [Mucilaginibacter xinganensis]